MPPRGPVWWPCVALDWRHRARGNLPTLVTSAHDSVYCAFNAFVQVGAAARLAGRQRHTALVSRPAASCRSLRRCCRPPLRANPPKSSRPPRSDSSHTSRPLRPLASNAGDGDGSAGGVGGPQFDAGVDAGACCAGVRPHRGAARTLQAPSVPKAGRFTHVLEDRDAEAACAGEGCVCVHVCARGGRAA